MGRCGGPSWIWPWCVWARTLALTFKLLWIFAILAWWNATQKRCMAVWRGAIPGWWPKPTPIGNCVRLFAVCEIARGLPPGSVLVKPSRPAKPCWALLMWWRVNVTLTVNNEKTLDLGPMKKPSLFLQPFMYCTYWTCCQRRRTAAERQGGMAFAGPAGR